MSGITHFLKSIATGLSAKHHAAEIESEIKGRLALEPTELMIDGSTEWIRNYLIEKGIPFQADHIMGEPYFHVKMTRADFNQMSKEAKKKKDGTYVSLMWDK